MLIGKEHYQECELYLERDDAAVAGLDDEVGFVSSPGSAEMPDSRLVVLRVDTQRQRHEALEQGAKQRAVRRRPWNELAAAGKEGLKGSTEQFNGNQLPLGL